MYVKVNFNDFFFTSITAPEEQWAAIVQHKCNNAYHGGGNRSNYFITALKTNDLMIFG